MERGGCVAAPHETDEYLASFPGFANYGSGVLRWLYGQLIDSRIRFKPGIE